MSKYFLCALSVSLFLLSCSNLKNIKVSQVEAIWFEYSPNQNLNNGSTFQGEILLQTYDGKQHDVSKNNKISFSSSDLRKSGNSYTIVKKSKAFNDDQCHLSLKYENKGEVYSSQDSMQMNFRGDLAILYNGAHGNNGKDQRNRTTPLLLRDGKNGETGENGGDGGASKSYTAHVWTIESMVYVHVKENNSNNFMKYKMTIGNDLLFNLSGGNGGDGGDGGDTSSDENIEINVKLVDFGLSKQLSLKRNTPKTSTLWYRAPDVLMGSRKYSTSVDIWSVGCIFAGLWKKK